MQIKLKLQADQEQQIEKQIKIQTDRQTVSSHQEKESRIQQKVKKVSLYNSGYHMDGIYILYVRKDRTGILRTEWEDQFVYN